MAQPENERQEREKQMFSEETINKRRVHAALKADAKTNPFLTEEQKKEIASGNQQNPEWD